VSVDIDSKSENELPWTGERYVPQIGGEIQLEHVHRYLVAREYATGKDVLDIACGEGFGSAILANSARSVVGVDIAAEAVEHAAACYRLGNVQFRQGSCTEIPLDSDSIDLVVSFETIEHHDEHKAMMAEIKRVLRPDGMLIISSPDKKEYSILPNYRNPFHVRELFKEEFEELIRVYFKNLALLSQRIVYGSGILPEAAAFHLIDYDIKDSSYARRGLARARYLIAVASDEPLPGLSGGLLEQPFEEPEIVKSCGEENEKRSVVIMQLEDKLRRLEEELRSQSAQSSEQVRRLEEQVGQLDLARIETEQLCQSISTSLSWKLTRPLRVLRDGDAITSILKKIQQRDKLLRPVSLVRKEVLDQRAISLATLISTSGFFDANVYGAAAEARAQGLDPALHYVLLGEAQGLKPSPAFDPVYYSERYPDVAAAGGNRLGHYLETGRAEGRRAVSIADTLKLPFRRDQTGEA
jgi:SAM-dependent methyltransferase